ncbi:undecaprenyl-diphosphate phosphatase [Candidatus Omnitrophota bacterium]
MRYAVLGVVQGLTEFLPVSSSGHLVLFSHIFNIDKAQILPIVIICHLGTLFSLFCFFARDIRRLLGDLVLIGQILLVTVITAAFALIGRGFFEGLFWQPAFVCSALLVTAVILIFSQRCKKEGRDINALNFKDAFWLGISQGFAIMPGLSRSGITIVSLLVRGVQPEAAFKFSFLAGIPAILGSFLFEAKAIDFAFKHPGHFWFSFGASFFFGLAGLFILRRMVKELKLHYFGYYLVPASILGLILTRT